MKFRFVQDIFVISFRHIVEKLYFYNLSGFCNTVHFDSSGIKIPVRKSLASLKKTSGHSVYECW